MTRDNFSEYTIDNTAKHLKRLAKNCDLNNPEEVKTFIAFLEKKDGTKTTDGYKHNLTNAYDRLAKYYKIQWEKPSYKSERRNVQIPTKEKLQMLIAYARRGLALKLRISRHGLRPIEVVTLRAKDIDTEHNLITPETAKGGIPRIIKIERELSETLRYEIISRQLNPTDYLFESKAKTDIERSHYYSKSYMAMRKRLSKQMNDPTIQKIKLYDFRHYDGTMFYLDCRDVPTTAHHLGHTDWKNTQIYVDLAKVLETGEDGEKYIVKVAHTDEEEMQLIENNFTFVNKRENPYTAFYRKRK